MLPIQTIYADILDKLQEHRTLLIQAPPGAGKSTFLPLQLVKDGVFKRIILLEPRRIAARNIASYLAQQLGEKLGQTVGLRMRNETRIGQQTRIEVVTEAVLTRMLQSDPELAGIDCLLFDEFHERSLHADTALAFALESQAALREDLSILIMSASLDSDTIANKLDCPVLTSEGRSYPIEIFYHPLPQERAWREQLPELIKKALTQHEGDCLVFLPAVKDIHYIEQQLSSFAQQNTIQLLCLHGRLPFKEQQKALAPSQQRKLILATNIAETSLTIDGVNIVVDSGKKREARFQLQSGISELVTCDISQSSALQRAGRAGRAAAGFAYRLGSAERFARLPAHDTPEILQQDISSFILECKQWGSPIEDLFLLDMPSQAQISAAEIFLQTLGALDDSYKITELGRKLLQHGGDLRINAMLEKACQLEGDYPSILDNALYLAALFESGYLRTQADITLRLEQALREKPAEFIKALNAWQTRFKHQCDLKKPPLYSDIVLALTYPDRIAMQRGQGYLMCNGHGVRVHQQAWSQSRFLAIAEVGGEQGSTVFSATALRIELLEEIAPELFQQHDICEFSEQEAKFIQESRYCLGKLILQRKPLQQELSSQQYLDAWLGFVKNKGLGVFKQFQQSRYQQLWIRLQLAHQNFEDEFPPSDEAYLLAHLNDWLSPYLNSIKNLNQLEQVDIEQALLSRLDWQQQQLLNEYLPSSITVASGNQRAIEYQLQGPAKLAVRMQEMFGCTSSPIIAQGKIELLIDLLSPANRTLHLTQDLAHFWQNAYKEVQKEMKGRYPKHYWPDDPSSAQATTKTKRHLSNTL